LMKKTVDDFGVGVAWIPAKKGPGSRLNGARNLMQLLKRSKDGKPGGFKVFRCCKHFIRTVPILMPDPDNWEDVDTAMEDHSYDEVRYSLSSRQMDADKPKPQETGPKPGTFDWLCQYGSRPETERSIYRRR